MKKTAGILGMILLAGGLNGGATGTGGAREWGSVSTVLGQPGTSLGPVQKYGWPRSDLRVTLSGVPVAPALALGSWAAFQRVGGSDEARVMGDLVLLGQEVNPVIRALQAGGFQILALHNHLIGETPRLLYMHYEGSGRPAALARTLVAALRKTGTPLAPGKTATAGPDARASAAFATIQTVLGRKGSLAGSVLQIGVPRADAVRDSGMEMPTAMGLANSMNFQGVGNRVATTGDFVLVADEVNPVIEELEAHGIEIEALHSHMLREEPRLFFMHFWGVGAPAKIAEGLRAALARIAVQKP